MGILGTNTHSKIIYHFSNHKIKYLIKNDFTFFMAIFQKIP